MIVPLRSTDASTRSFRDSLREEDVISLRTAGDICLPRASDTVPLLQASPTSSYGVGLLPAEEGREHDMQYYYYYYPQHHRVYHQDFPDPYRERPQEKYETTSGEPTYKEPYSRRSKRESGSNKENKNKREKKKENGEGSNRVITSITLDGRGKESSKRGQYHQDEYQVPVGAVYQHREGALAPVYDNISNSAQMASGYLISVANNGGNNACYPNATLETAPWRQKSYYPQVPESGGSQSHHRKRHHQNHQTLSSHHHSSAPGGDSSRQHLQLQGLPSQQHALHLQHQSVASGSTSPDYHLRWDLHNIAAAAPPARLVNSHHIASDRITSHHIASDPRLSHFRVSEASTAAKSNSTLYCKTAAKSNSTVFCDGRCSATSSSQMAKLPSDVGYLTSHPITSCGPLFMCSSANNNACCVCMESLNEPMTLQQLRETVDDPPQTCCVNPSSVPQIPMIPQIPLIPQLPVGVVPYAAPRSFRYSCPRACKKEGLRMVFQESGSSSCKKRGIRNGLSTIW